MKLPWILILPVFSLCIAIQGMAQHSDENKGSYFSIGMQADYGFVIIHSKNIEAVRDSYPWGTGIDLTWHHNDLKSWEICNCYPKLGFSATYWNFDNPEILGWGLSELFYVEPFFNHHHKFSYSIRAGFGLSYMSNSYDEIENPKNLSYSTTIGIPLLLNISANYKVNKQLLASFSVNYNHISNGGVREPNKGINYPTISIGVDYYFQKTFFTDRTKVDWKLLFGQEKRFDISLFASLKQLSHSEFKKYPVYGIDVKGSKRVGRISALTLGIEYLADESNLEELKRANRSNIDHKRGGIAAGHEFLLGRLIFSQQFGVYIYNPYKADDDVYQRYGLIFRISKKFSAGINLKAHRQVADFIDFRMSYSFIF